MRRACFRSEGSDVRAECACNQTSCCICCTGMAFHPRASVSRDESNRSCSLDDGDVRVRVVLRVVAGSVWFFVVVGGFVWILIVVVGSFLWILIVVLVLCMVFVVVFGFL